MRDNILIVSNMYPSDKYPSYGIFVKRFCDQLDKLDINYSLSVMNKSSNAIDKIARYIKFVFYTIYVLLKNEYGIVYVHYGSHSSIPVYIARKIKKFDIYVNLHGSDAVPENFIQNKLVYFTKKILKISEKVIVPSEYFKDYVCKKYNVDSNIVYVYPSAGVNKDIFKPSPNSIIKNLKAKYSISDNTILFGMAGRISYLKGWDTFVEAISILRNQNIAAKFFIIGDGNEKEELDRMIYQKKLKDNIIKIELLPQEKLANYYSMLDYFVFPTKREGESLGLVAIEAMACGTPVIASDFAAPKYYVKNGINGFKFNVNDSHDLARKMEYCANIKGVYSLYSSLVTGAIKTAEEYYNDSLLPLLRDILK